MYYNLDNIKGGTALLILSVNYNLDNIIGGAALLTTRSISPPLCHLLLTSCVHVRINFSVKLLLFLIFIHMHVALYSSLYFETYVANASEIWVIYVSNMWLLYLLLTRRVQVHQIW